VARALGAVVLRGLEGSAVVVLVVRRAVIIMAPLALRILAVVVVAAR